MGNMRKVIRKRRRAVKSIRMVPVSWAMYKDFADQIKGVGSLEGARTTRMFCLAGGAKTMNLDDFQNRARNGRRRYGGMRALARPPRTKDSKTIPDGRAAGVGKRKNGDPGGRAGAIVFGLMKNGGLGPERKPSSSGRRRMGPERGPSSHGRRMGRMVREREPSILRRRRMEISEPSRMPSSLGRRGSGLLEP